MEKSKPVNDQRPPQTGVRILCIDGGGMRGIIALQLLMKLLGESNSSISDHFDLVCGTSIGGIITLAMIYLKKTPKEAKKFLEDLGSEIFDSGKICQASRASSEAEAFSSDELVKVLQQKFGSLMLTDVLYPKIFVVSTNCTLSEPEVFLFRNYAADLSFAKGTKEAAVWQAARATSAAPSYFRRYEYPELDGEMRKFDLVDGGLVANNPVLLARNEAFRLWPNIPIDYIISIGTGSTPIVAKHQSSPSNPSAALTNTINDVIAILTSSEDIHKKFLVDKEVNGWKLLYYRVNPNLPKMIQLDNYKAVSLMEEIVTKYLAANEQYINEIIKMLKKNKFE